MPAYNAEATIDRAIRSIFAQRRTDWELIVVDDGSTDGTYEAATLCAGTKPRVKIQRHPNEGPAAARNRAAAMATGEYLCFLDADDEFKPEYLERVAMILDGNPEIDFVSCNALCVAPSGSKSLWRSGRHFRYERAFTLIDIIPDNHIFIMATLRRDVFVSVNGFRTELPASHDYDLWLRVLAEGSSHLYTPDVLGVYHRSSTSISGNPEREMRAVKMMIKNLTSEHVLSPRERSAALGRLRRVEAREDLERRIRTNDMSGTRMDVVRHVAAFRRPTKRSAGIMLGLISPRLYFQSVTRRRREQLRSLYEASPKS
jgi:glycosyltransferase involved in cell wall biosynthesis